MASIAPGGAAPPPLPGGGGGGRDWWLPQTKNDPPPMHLINLFKKCSKCEWWKPNSEYLGGRTGIYKLCSICGRRGHAGTQAGGQPNRQPPKRPGPFQQPITPQTLPPAIRHPTTPATASTAPPTMQPQYTPPTFAYNPQARGFVPYVPMTEDSPSAGRARAPSASVAGQRPMLPPARPTMPPPARPASATRQPSVTPARGNSNSNNALVTPVTGDQQLRTNNKPPPPYPGRIWFRCERCHIPRPVAYLDTTQADEICRWCTNPHFLFAEVAWCIPSNHESARLDFQREDGEEDFTVCVVHMPPGSPRTEEHRRRVSNADSVASDRTQGGSRHNPGQAERRRQEQERQRALREAHLTREERAMPRLASDSADDQAAFQAELDGPALHPDEFDLLKNFNAKLDEQVMDDCTRCDEKCFDMGLDEEGVCKNCRTTRKTHDLPHKMTAANKLDPGKWPVFEGKPLPKLSEMEERIIARVHVHFDMRKVSKDLSGFKGSTVNLLRDVGKTYTDLPRLPHEIDTIVIRPANRTAQMDKVFAEDFLVRKKVLHTWLRSLKDKHPGYANINIVKDRLDFYGYNENIIEHFTSNSDGLGGEAAGGDAPPPESSPPTPVELELPELPPRDTFDARDIQYDYSAVPNLMPDDTELAKIRQFILPLLQRGTLLQQLGINSDNISDQLSSIHLTDSDAPRGEAPQAKDIPPGFVTTTPIDAFNISHKLLSLAFPSLYPMGAADFLEPRVHSVSYFDYIQHFIKYKDGRFAKHKTWRFVIYNTLMRQQIKKRVNFIMSKPDDDRDSYTLDGLKAALTADSSDPIAKKILDNLFRHAEALAGTMPYWTGKRKQLETYIRALGDPSFFHTESSGNVYWQSLARHMPGYDRWQAGDTMERVRFMRNAVKDNPHIAAYHFYHRFLAFHNEVLVPKFGIVDHWSRVEFQQSGAAHQHAFAWMKSPPAAMEDDQAAYAEYWGRLIKAEDPLLPHPPSLVPTALQAESAAMINDFHTLTDIIARVQRHKCTPDYCLRSEGHPQAGSCKFHYPRRQHDIAAVVADLNPNHFMFDPARSEDEKYINGYCRLLAMAWLANTDIAPCTSIKAVLEYIAKYASRAQKRSESLAAIARQVMSRASAENPVESFFTGMLTQLAGERDVSDEEAMYILMNSPLQLGSRQVQGVDCRPLESHAKVQVRDRQTGELIDAASVWQKYMKRDDHMKDDVKAENGELTFWNFARLFDWSRKYWQPRPKALPRLLNCFPWYSSDVDGTEYEDWCRVKIVMHHPFTEYPKLPYTFEDDEMQVEYQSWSTAYAHCAASHTGRHDSDYLTDLQVTVPAAAVAADDEEDGDAAIAALYAAMPDRADGVETAALGQRQIDTEHDWTEHVGRYRMKESDKEWWAEQRDEAATDAGGQRIGKMSGDFTPALLVQDQRFVYDAVVQHYEDCCAGVEVKQLLINVDGQAGTGKSLVIEAISSRLEEIADATGNVNPIIRLAPTGVAANNIRGRTLHSALRLPTGNVLYTALQGEALQSLQAELRDVRYIIVDEKSMLSLTQLSWVERRCREAKASQASFGGMNVILFGDFWQLTPVAARALYAAQDGNWTQEDHAGRNVWYTFTHHVRFTVIKRQGEAPAFRDALNGLRRNMVGLNDWETLVDRIAMKLSDAERASFDSAVRIMSTKKQVTARNAAAMESLNQPGKLVKAVNTGTGAAGVGADLAGNLQSLLPLSLNSRVMVTSNIWTEKGVVNGAMGVVRDVVCGPTWAGYTGPGNHKKVVPIFDRVHKFEKNFQACTRRQFPLNVAFAITVHKSQGMTLEKVVLNFADKDFTPGLSYVAASRVRTLDSIMFKESFDYERFRVKAGKTEADREADLLRRTGTGMFRTAEMAAGVQRVYEALSG